ncbi:MAG: hypothetical protein LBF63_00505 [Treponema sp.]|jgi:hypothetical protein|nr:hypothetical protein [Treponema sp.]
MNKAETIIAKYLDEIDEVYPPERKRKIIDRSERFWKGEKAGDRIPYAAMVLGTADDIPDDLSPQDRELVTALAGIAKHGRDWDDDYYPALSPGLRQSTLPSYFGCIEEHASDSVRVKPVIAEPADVYKLPRLDYDDPHTSGGEMLAKMRYWRNMTKGRILMYETDMQGPFSVASQIWGVEQFLLAIYESPEEVRFLADCCTDMLTGFTRKMFDAAEGGLIPYHCHPWLWFPKENGMALSEDLVAVISGETVEEFINPCLEKVVKSFGGVVVHTCGDMNHVLDALCKVKGLKGVNFSSSETDLQKALHIKRKDLRVVCHGAPVAKPGLPLRTPLEHAAYCGQCAREAGEDVYCLAANVDKSLTPLIDAEIREVLRV